MEPFDRIASFYRRSSGTQVYGIDFVRPEIRENAKETGCFNLYIHLIARPDEHQFPKIAAANIVITQVADGNHVHLDLRELKEEEAGVWQLLVSLPAPGSIGPYRVTLVDVPDLIATANSAVFFLHEELHSDPLTPAAPTSLPVVSAGIDYLARDYTALRELMLDRMAQNVPQWTERSEADIGIAIIEMLAFAADRFSYYQDAVATEAYLTTARRATSLRRHARMLAYQVNRGRNARAWIQVQVGGRALRIEEGSRFANAPGAFSAVSSDKEAIREPAVYASMHPKICYPNHNHLPFFREGIPGRTLEKGATSAPLLGEFRHLQAGDVLIFQSGHRDAGTWRATSYAAPVRLTQIEVQEDQLTGTAITLIHWHVVDALPAPLAITRKGIHGEEEAAVAAGNILLADQGRALPFVDLPTVPTMGVYQPQLSTNDILFGTPIHDTVALSASETLHDPPGTPRPLIRILELREDGSGGFCSWKPVSCLLDFGPYDRVFVVETDPGEKPRLRFGDGVFGMKPVPGTRFRASPRVGGEDTGRVGPNTLNHLDSANDLTSNTALLEVTNPIASGGFRLPERADAIRVLAPNQVNQQKRAVTAAEFRIQLKTASPHYRFYAAVSWDKEHYTAKIAVAAVNNRAVPTEILQAVTRFTASIQMMFGEVRVYAAPYLGLVLKCRLLPMPGQDPGALREKVRQHLFSPPPGADGPRFGPGGFSFGETVRLDRIMAEILKIKGVKDVHALAFYPAGQPPALKKVIRPHPDTIPVIDDLPGQPARGYLYLETARRKDL